MAGSTGISKLINFATYSSIGYGLFLGAVQAPKRPKDLEDAKKEANFGNYGGHLIRDVGLGLIDDLALLPPLHLLGRFRPKLKNVTHGLAGAIGAIGGGIAGAVAAHDTMNFMEARSYMRGKGQNLDLPDYRMNAIDGFQSSGAGRVIRKQLTGISSPASQAIYKQILHNPYADLLTEFIRTPEEKGGGEAPSRNPVRSGLAASTLVGAGAFAAGGRFGFGKATLASMALGTGAGIWAVNNSGASSQDKLQGYSAVLETAIPTLGIFGALQGTRALKAFRGRSGVLGLIGRAGGLADSSLSKLASGIGKFGTDYGPRSAISLELAAQRSGKVISELEHKAFTSGAMEGIDRALRTSTGQLSKWGESSAFGNHAADWLGKITGAASDAIVRHAKTTPTSSLLNRPLEWGAKAYRAVGNAVLFPMLEHSGHQSTTWEQSLALGHLVAVGPHMYHGIHGMITGEYDTYGIGEDSKAPTKRKKHSTSSMPSNRSR